MAVTGAGLTVGITSRVVVGVGDSFTGTAVGNIGDSEAPVKSIAGLSDGDA